MKGFAVAIRREDGSLFFASPASGFATPVWFRHAEAMGHAHECHRHKLDAIVVNVEYTDPIITGPARVLRETPNAS